ncbi:streptomycin 3-adenylyltransferase [Fontibacillus panacisegetis]|uniref:Spectinomycin 9-adenylyltransferase n=1 Tax=Fontibacillus panacisegetis TaxID=670482 RepID=A0A1G7TNZ9_9BACL|nr:aminoglycoside adenylyltransferase domain-containing protein [Fontibacillus panacisegetis]SDG36200.1 streptomycin 3-adenylyltransferase [Fontibacillus panacisegetis]
MNQQIILDNVTCLLKEELSESVIGIYLHGSMAMGCFNPAQSDIDILVIIREKQPIDIYKKIARKLINIEDEMNVIKGFELSIVLEAYADNFVYPTPFEFHYSSFHKEKYKTDENYFCGGYEDSDLAAHFVITYNRGIVLFGEQIKNVIKPIDKRYYVESIKSDVDEALEGITDNPIYYVLNLSRVLLYLRDSVISSKKEAGEWALNMVPTEYKDVIAQCLAKYNNEVENLNLSKKTLLNYATYMLEEIEELTIQQ